MQADRRLDDPLARRGDVLGPLSQFVLPRHSFTLLSGLT
jgi:hypothetical protein